MKSKDQIPTKSCKVLNSKDPSLKITKSELPKLYTSIWKRAESKDTPQEIIESLKFSEQKNIIKSRREDMKNEREKFKMKYNIYLPSF